MEDIFLNIFQKRFIITTFEFFPKHIFQYVSAKNMLVCPPLYQGSRHISSFDALGVRNNQHPKFFFAPEPIFKLSQSAPLKVFLTSLFWLTSTSANPCRKLFMYNMFVHQKFRQFVRSSGVPSMTASRLGQLGKNLSYKVA